MSKPTNPTVAEMVESYLQRNGFDGLYYYECGCDLDDFMPCGDLCDNCKAGYKRPCDCEDGCNFHITAEKVGG